jgi:Fe-S-cluster containining protein
VEKLITNEKLLQEVAEIYNWLDSQISEKLSGKCEACGQCCDFITFDHRLYVTIPELMYLAAKLKVDTLKSMPQGQCPYNIEGKCSVYLYRFSGCRIFNCKADTEVQSELSEITIGKLKQLSAKFGVTYRYSDLAAALNECLIFG